MLGAAAAGPRQCRHRARPRARLWHRRYRRAEPATSCHPTARRALVREPRAGCDWRQCRDAACRFRPAGRALSDAVAMIDPGRLKTRLTIQAPSELDDGQGGVTRSFTTIATVWAAVT